METNVSVMDWVIPGGYLLAAVILAVLVSRLKKQALESRRNAMDSRRLAVLGANASSCMPCMPSRRSVVEWAAEQGRPVAMRVDGTLRFGDEGGPVNAVRWSTFRPTKARTLVLPLRACERTVGVLSLMHDSEIDLDPHRQRLVSTLMLYAGLAAERASLERESSERLDRAALRLIPSLH